MGGKRPDLAILPKAKPNFSVSKYKVIVAKCWDHDMGLRPDFASVSKMVAALEIK